MKFVKIARRPAFYSRQLYAKSSDAALLPYSEQKDWYCSDFFGPVDTWETYLPEAGYDATDIINGVPELDAAWYRENEGAYLSEPMAVLAAQLKSLRPDILFLEAIESFTNVEIEVIRSWLPDLKLLAGMTGTDIRTNPALYAVDAVFTCMPQLVEELKNQGKPAYYLPHSFDPRVLKKIDVKREIDEDIVFLGNIIPGAHLHDYRREVLETIANFQPCTIYSDQNTIFLIELLAYSIRFSGWSAAKLMDKIGIPFDHLPGGRKLKAAAAKPDKPSFGFSSILAKLMAPSVYGLGMYQALRNSRLTVNVHAGLADNYAANMRLFESTGVGTCLVTDRKDNLRSLFEPDKEIVDFGSADEAAEKIEWLLDNPSMADEIAINGQKRTLSDHSFRNRVPILTQAFNELLAAA